MFSTSIAALSGPQVKTPHRGAPKLCDAARVACPALLRVTRCSTPCMHLERVGWTPGLECKSGDQATYGDWPTNRGDPTIKQTAWPALDPNRHASSTHLIHHSPRAVLVGGAAVLGQQQRTGQEVGVVGRQRRGGARVGKAVGQLRHVGDAVARSCLCAGASTHADAKIWSNTPVS